jgi:hypothetical protein
VQQLERAQAPADQRLAQPCSRALDLGLLGHDDAVRVAARRVEGARPRASRLARVGRAAA